MFFRACRHHPTKSAKWGHLIPFSPLVCKWGNCPLCPGSAAYAGTTTANRLISCCWPQSHVPPYKLFHTKKSSTTSLVIPLTDRETEKLNTQRQKHNLLGGGKNSNWQNVVWQRRLTMLQLPTCIRLNTRVYATTGCDSSCLRPTILMSVSRSIVVLLWY